MFTRLPFTSRNTGLQTLRMYDAAPIKDQILSLSSLRAFYDFSDPATMSLTGAAINQVNDLSGNGLHLTAASTDRPTWVPGALGWSGAALFSESRMTVDNLFPEGPWGTVVAGYRGYALDETSRMVVADTNIAQSNFYTTNTILRGFGGITLMNVAAINGRNVQPIWTYDFSGEDAKSKIYADGQIDTDLAVPWPKPAGAGAVGGYTDANIALNRLSAYLTHVIVLEADASADPVLLELLKEYGRRMMRVAVI